MADLLSIYYRLKRGDEKNITFTDADLGWMYPGFIRIYPGFMMDLWSIYYRSKRGDGKKITFTHADLGWMYPGFIPDLFMKKTLPGGAARNKGCHKSDPPLGPRT